MQLRPYQVKFVVGVENEWSNNQRVLGVAATGAGKTVMAAELIRRNPRGRFLFLADARELVHQASMKITQWCAEFPGIEMAEDHAQLSDRIVVATTQSMDPRLDKWPRDAFSHIIIDEAHRNTLGNQAQKVLGHFANAKVLGITATPFRSDKQQLGSYYEAIAYEVGLFDLIREGYLSRITVKSVPANIDLQQVRTTAGDYNAGDLGAALSPHLMHCAELLAEHASDRKTVVFLPLVDVSKEFAECCKSVGLRAVHVDGNDRSALRSDWQVICNASLLTTGWDCPDVDCVYILRPTKSLVLYMQMVGRGTRIAPGKKDLLLLDPLFLSDTMQLIRPSRLIAKTAEDAKYLQDRLDLEGGDLLEQEEEAVADRRAAMFDRLAQQRRRQARTVDAMEWALSLNAVEVVEYEPEMKWESAPMSDKQREMLEKNGFDVEAITGKGHASKIIDLLMTRRQMGLATPKQMRLLQRFDHPAPATCTFADASAFIDSKIGKRN